MDLIHGGSVAALEDALRFREARGSVLASNLANVDTPGYRRREMHFVDALEQAVSGPVRTHPGHLEDPQAIRRIVTVSRSVRSEPGPTATA